MRERFTERNGISDRVVIQITSLDERTRIALWNVIVRIRDLNVGRFEESVDSAAREIWMGQFDQPVDEYTSFYNVWVRMKGVVLQREIGYVFDLVEALADILPKHLPTGVLFAHFANEVFENFLVDYRIVNGLVVRSGSDTEVEAIEDGLDAAKPYSGALHHLDRALALFGDREHPDFANSVKESLSAVESLSRELTGAKSFGAAIDALPSKGIAIDPAQRAAWKSMYGWASNESGVRHGGETAPRVDSAIARYTLVTASAFVTLLVDWARKAPNSK